MGLYIHGGGGRWALSLVNCGPVLQAELCPPNKNICGSPHLCSLRWGPYLERVLFQMQIVKTRACWGRLEPHPVRPMSLKEQRHRHKGAGARRPCEVTETQRKPCEEGGEGEKVTPPSAKDHRPSPEGTRQPALRGRQPRQHLELGHGASTRVREAIPVGGVWL